ncbi:MAG: DUF1294 domain-containing protein [Eubacterium sp.]
MIKFIIIYFALINLISSALAVVDKRRAIRHKHRISESTLITFGLLGGALGEYLTMRLIHHKTLHRKFMTGLPLIIISHILIAIMIIIKTAHLI